MERKLVASGFELTNKILRTRGAHVYDSVPEATHHPHLAGEAAPPLPVKHQSGILKLPAQPLNVLSIGTGLEPTALECPQDKTC